MYIECFTDNGKPYLRLVRSVRVTKPDGRKVTQKQPVFNIGSLERFDDGQPNYIERLKESYKAGKPLIPSLEPYCTDAHTEETHHFSIEEGSPFCFAHPKLFSHVLLERIMEELGLDSLFASYKRLTKAEYDVYGFAKLLIFGRLLRPASPSATVRQNQDYYGLILRDYNPDNVYDTLDFIYADRDRIIRQMNAGLAKKVGHFPEVIYYNVTSFSLETEDPDEDIPHAETHFLERETRIMGITKEWQKPLDVRVGLFMDDSGFPLAMETFTGNTVDPLTLLSALEKNREGLGFPRFITVADRGICGYPKLLRVKDTGNGYIVPKSLVESTKEEQAWAYSGDGYISREDGIEYKSRVVKRNVIDELGNSRKIEEKVVVYRNAKFRERAEVRDGGLRDFLQKLREHPENVQLTASRLKSLRKFYKKGRDNGAIDEILDASEVRVLVDFEKVEEYYKRLGCHQIVTSELNMDAGEVIDKYCGRTKVDELFRAMKRDLKARSFFVRTPEQLTAHVLLCVIAMIMLRTIQKRLITAGKDAPSPSAHRGVAMNVRRIREALLKWKVNNLPGDLYHFVDVDDPDLRLILNAFAINIPAKLFRKAELKQIKTGIKI